MKRLLIVGALVVASSGLSILGACDTDGQRGDTGFGEQCEETIECVVSSYCWNDICVQEGKLEFSLLWTTTTDLDLYVQTPFGDTIGWNATAAAGGYYGVTDCFQGCEIADGNHVEHIFFPSEAAGGTYEIYAHNFDGMNAADFTIEVHKNGETVETFSGSLPASVAGSPHYEHYYTE